MLTTLQTIRERVHAHVSVRVYDAVAVSIALACSLLESDDLVSYMFEGSVRREVLANRETLALTDAEFTDLFGVTDPAKPAQYNMMPSKRLKSVTAMNGLQQLRAQQELALTCTLLEAPQKSAWDKYPFVRLAAFVALLRTSEYEQCVSAVVGGLVRADARRIDDLRSTIEDGGIDIIFVCEVVTGLAESVTGSN